jgi:phytoene/squalene synthetase
MNTPSGILAKAITLQSSKQSYYTARLMVDKALEVDCYRAYGYFRWADDVVDEECQTQEARLAFIHRQQALATQFYRGEHPDDLAPQEQILADLIQHARGNPDLLRSYIDNFLAIIEFDAGRKGQMVSQAQLDWYARTLGKAVTDGIQYFICNGHPYPDAEQRYLAATGAHITHMLRDLGEDIPDGYINIPSQCLAGHHLDPTDYSHPAMRAWVKGRVELARAHFKQGKQYLDDLVVLRCKIVGYWYCARFEHLLARIEADDYMLRDTYAKPSRLLTWLKFGGLALRISLSHWRSYLAANGCWVRQESKTNPHWQPIQAE